MKKQTWWKKGQKVLKSHLRTQTDFDEFSFFTLQLCNTSGWEGGVCTCAWDPDLHKTFMSRWQKRPESSERRTYGASWSLWLHPVHIALSLTWIKPWKEASSVPAEPDHLIHMPWQASSQPLSLTSQKTHLTWKPQRLAEINRKISWNNGGSVCKVWVI